MVALIIIIFVSNSSQNDWSDLIKILFISITALHLILNELTWHQILKASIESLINTSDAACKAANVSNYPELEAMAFKWQYEMETEVKKQMARVKQPIAKKHDMIESQVSLSTFMPADDYYIDRATRLSISMSAGRNHALEKLAFQTNIKEIGANQTNNSMQMEEKQSDVAISSNTTQKDSKVVMNENGSNSNQNEGNGTVTNAKAGNKKFLRSTSIDMSANSYNIDRTAVNSDNVAKMLSKQLELNNKNKNKDFTPKTRHSSLYMPAADKKIDRTELNLAQYRNAGNRKGRKLNSKIESMGLNRNRRFSLQMSANELKVARKKDGIKQVAVEMNALPAEKNDNEAEMEMKMEDKDKDRETLETETKEKENDSVKDKNKEVAKVSDEIIDTTDATVDSNDAEMDENEKKGDETFDTEQIEKNVAITKKEFYNYDDAFSGFTFAMPSRLLPVDNDR